MKPFPYDEFKPVFKEELKALHRGVEVPQRDYDEVVAVKAMFLINDYR